MLSCPGDSVWWAESGAEATPTARQPTTSPLPRRLADVPNGRQRGSRGAGGGRRLSAARWRRGGERSVPRHRLRGGGDPAAATVGSTQVRPPRPPAPAPRACGCSLRMRCWLQVQRRGSAPGTGKGLGHPSEDPEQRVFISGTSHVFMFCTW